MEPQAPKHFSGWLSPEMPITKQNSYHLNKWKLVPIIRKWARKSFESGEASQKGSELNYYRERNSGVGGEWQEKGEWGRY